MNNQGLQDLGNRVRELATTCRTLDTFLAEGAAQLLREAEVKRLETMATRICEYVAEAKSSENRAQRAWQTGDSLVGIGKLIVKGIDFTDGKHAGLDAFKKNIAALPSSKQPCFGTIMVGVDRGGLPDDVHVISISGRAREQYQTESGIIQELQRRGMLLFYPDVFHAMVDRLIKQLHEGKIRLPILPKQLPAGLAIPRKVPVRLLTSVQWVPQLPAPQDTGTGDKGNSPNDTI